MSEPVILVVDDDPQVLSAIRRDLKERYQTEYRILAASIRGIRTRNLART